MNALVMAHLPLRRRFPLCTRSQSGVPTVTSASGTLTFEGKVPGARHQPEAVPKKDEAGAMAPASLPMIRGQYVIVRTRAEVPLQVPRAQVPAWPETMLPFTVNAWAAPLPVAAAAERLNV